MKSFDRLALGFQQLSRYYSLFTLSGSRTGHHQWRWVFSNEVYENYVSDLMTPFCFDSGKMELKVEKEHNFEIHQGCTCPRPLQSQFISAFIYFELFHLFVVGVIFISY